MIGLIVVGLLVLAVVALAAWRWLPSPAYLPLAAALSLGLAGYAWQGRPMLPGAPVQRVVSTQTSGERIDKPLMGMVRRLDAATNWLMLSDSLARSGDSESAAKVLAKATKLYPQSADLWVGYGAALLAHSDGQATRASDIAFAEARRRDPGHPGPDFYQGIAAVRAGDLDEAERLWSRVYQRTDGDAAWRQDLAQRLTLVRALIAQRDAGLAAGPAGAGDTSPQQ